MHVTAIIVAAGSGTRFGGRVPKQYELLGRKPVLRRTIERFSEHPAVDDVLVVIGNGHDKLFAQASSGLEVLPATIGGADRQASVLAGLEALSESPTSHVLIHDAARPLVSTEVIGDAIEGLKHHQAVLPIVPVADSLKKSENGFVSQALDRNGVVIAQTPQGFDYAAILQAHRKFAGRGLSDDAAVAAHAGMAIATVPGAVDNLKLTTPGDMRRAEAYLGANTMRTACGTGFDVHRFDDARPLWLCGIEIDHPRGLAGHSDADVGLHAITDAIFGALADGDIGSHFPPSDPQWKDAASDQFLAHAASLVRQRGGTIGHLDLTLICEEPKIGPHRDVMRRRIAQIVGIDPHKVAVKATTSEGLGFTGRREGIAAQAMATLDLPE